jgi:hypothetical protein
MSDPSNVAINPDTIEQLATYGIDANGKLAPEMLLVNKFRISKGLYLVGGLIALVRYAGGWFSNAISGLSNCSSLL